MARRHDVEDLVGREDPSAVPRVGRADGHLLDDPQLDAPLQAVVDQVGQARLVDAAQHQGVDLDRRQAGLDGGVDAREHVPQAVPAGDRGEKRGVQGIEGDVHAPQPRCPQRAGAPGQPQRVRRHREVGGPPLVGRQLRAASDDPLQAPAQQRLAPGEPDLADPELLDADADQADDLPVGEGGLGGQPVQALGRHAVGAAQVAPVGQGHAQVARHAPEAVDEARARGRGRPEARGTGGLEFEGHGATLPRSGAFLRAAPLCGAASGTDRPRPRSAGGQGQGTVPKQPVPHVRGEGLRILWAACGSKAGADVDAVLDAHGPGLVGPRPHDLAGALRGHGFEPGGHGAWGCIRSRCESGCGVRSSRRRSPHRWPRPRGRRAGTRSASGIKSLE